MACRYLQIVAVQQLIAKTDSAALPSPGGAGGYGYSPLSALVFLPPFSKSDTTQGLASYHRFQRCGFAPRRGSAPARQINSLRLVFLFFRPTAILLPRPLKAGETEGWHILIGLGGKVCLLFHYFFFFVSFSTFFSSPSNLRCSFFTSSAAGRFSGTMPLLVSISLTAKLLSMCSFSILV